MDEFSADDARQMAEQARRRKPPEVIDELLQNTKLMASNGHGSTSKIVNVTGFTADDFQAVLGDFTGRGFSISMPSSDGVTATFKIDW